MRQVLLVALFATTATAIGADETASDKDRLQGEWSIVSRERNGKVSAINKSEGMRIDKDKMVMIDKNDPCDSCEFTMTLSPDEDPKELDLKYTGSTDDLEDFEPGDDILQGIYQLAGDKLTVCMSDGGADRPSEFKTTEGQKAYLLVYERVK